MASQRLLPSPPREIFRRHDLLLPSGIYRTEIRQSINIVFLLVSSRGDVIVRQVAPLELEAHTARIYRELYDEWRGLEPESRPTLVTNAAPRTISARTRRVLEQLGYEIPNAIVAS